VRPLNALFDSVQPEACSGQDESVRPPTIDLNADLGEVDGDLDLMAVVSSVNVACGGHAGDTRSMAAAVEEAIAAGVRVGAHPSYPDRAGFGRVELALRSEEIAGVVAEQVAALAAVAGAAGTTVSHLKLHGALYHRAADDAECAEVILQSLQDAGLGPLPVLAQPGAAMAAAARRRGWPSFEEGFCDRAYRSDGSLADRSEHGAVLATPAAAAAQAVEIAVLGGVHAGDGSWVPLRPASLCVHGDSPGALQMARAVRHALEDAGVVIAPFSEP
jgi:UPF0271 protein